MSIYIIFFNEITVNAYKCCPHAENTPLVLTNMTIFRRKGGSSHKNLKLIWAKLKMNLWHKVPSKFCFQALSRSSSSKVKSIYANANINTALIEPSIFMYRWICLGVAHLFWKSECFILLILFSLKNKFVPALAPCLSTQPSILTRASSVTRKTDACML